MVGLLSPEEIESVLRRHRVGRIGCLLEDRPYVVPVNYGYDGVAIYVASADGQKIDAMRARPRVCFQVDEIEGTAMWRSVVADGVYEELTCDCERRNALKQIAQAGTAGRPCGLDPSDEIILFRIRLTEKSGRFGLGR